jgi:hypothetical protein
MTIDMASFITFIFGLLVAVVAEEIFGWMLRLAQWLVCRNLKRLPSQLQDRYKEEWLAHLDALPGRLSKLAFAIDTYRASYKISHYFLHPHIFHWTPIILRAFELTIAGIALVIELPLFLFIALLIKLDSRGPVIQKHREVFEDGKEFERYAFRTWTCAKRYGLSCEHGRRVTVVGKFLRRFNMVQLPMLFNCLSGDMSFVGLRCCRQGMSMSLYFKVLWLNIKGDMHISIKK